MPEKYGAGKKGGIRREKALICSKNGPIFPSRRKKNTQFRKQVGRLAVLLNGRGNPALKKEVLGQPPR